MTIWQWLGVAIVFVLGAIGRKLIGDEGKERVIDLPANVLAHALAWIPERDRSEFRLRWSSEVEALTRQAQRYGFTALMKTLRFGVRVYAAAARHRWPLQPAARPVLAGGTIVTRSLYPRWAMVTAAGVAIAAFTGVVLQGFVTNPARTQSVAIDQSAQPATTRSLAEALPESSLVCNRNQESGVEVAVGQPVNPDLGWTSCGFAMNVAQAYHDGGSISGDYRVFSPASDEILMMNCRKSSFAVCTGGAHALVYVA